MRHRDYLQSDFIQSNERFQQCWLLEEDVFGTVRPFRPLRIVPTINMNVNSSWVEVVKMRFLEDLQWTFLRFPTGKIHSVTVCFWQWNDLFEDDEAFPSVQPVLPSITDISHVSRQYSTDTCSKQCIKGMSSLFSESLSTEPLEVVRRVHRSWTVDDVKWLLFGMRWMSRWTCCWSSLF